LIFFLPEPRCIRGVWKELRAVNQQRIVLFGEFQSGARRRSARPMKWNELQQAITLAGKVSDEEIAFYVAYWNSAHCS
jgi:hypothetical protein